jgi:hypothetical protein
LWIQARVHIRSCPTGAGNSYVFSDCSAARHLAHLRRKSTFLLRGDRARISLIATDYARQHPELVRHVICTFISRFRAAERPGAIAVTQHATFAKTETTSAGSVRFILQSQEFRQAYHRALDSADKTPAAQCRTARSVIEAYFDLEMIAANAPLKPESIYFTERPIEVRGNYKCLIRGAVNRDMLPGPVCLLQPKAASVERLLDTKEFERAISAVEAVRLTLMPERVNGIISFILDASRFYANHDTASAERAIGTALDHFERAATDGLRRIKTEAEKGKKANEVAGTRRKLANVRHTLQAELIDHAKTKS